MELDFLLVYFILALVHKESVWLYFLNDKYSWTKEYIWLLVKLDVFSISA